jgi:predicted flap endonuclease-1-like 5' DNA nuclease
LAGWLLLTAVFAALAGWAFAAQRAAAGDTTLRRERDHLVRDIVALASGESGAANDSVGAEREIDAVRRMGEIHIGRIAELERALSAARANADSAAAQAAELQRLLDARDEAPVEAEYAEAEPAAETNAEDEAVALHGWRLRYFEQRVRYLESAAGQATAPVVADEAPPVHDWRARVAEAEAAYLADEARAAPAAPDDPEEEEATPFAANADVDMLLRWRKLYLERRVAYLQNAAAEAPPAVLASEPGPDPERWKWRARYLEARMRHLEQRLTQAPGHVVAAAEPEADAEPVRPMRKSAKPAMLASARNGAPDDFTLIDGVSPQQQTTLYTIGVFHFDQVAAWTPENVAWVDQYLRLRGRIEEEEWVEQAGDLAREGPAAARRVLEDEDV